MADVKWSDNTAFPPQISVTNDAYLVGLTNSPGNSKYPVYLFKQAINSAVTYNTSTALTGSDIAGGIIRSTPTTTGVVLTLPTASSIYNAMGGSPAVGFYIDCQIENLSGFDITLTKSDGNLFITGLVGTIIGPYQTFYLRFTVTSLSPHQITIDGGQVINVANNVSNLLVVSENGSDTTGNGSFDRPYASVSYALTQATIGQSTILVTPGIYNENVALLPSVGIVGFGNQLSVINGALTTNSASWDATTNPHLDLLSVGFTGSANIVGGSGIQYGNGDNLRIKNCFLPDGTIIDRISSIKITNSTQATNLSITTPSNVLIQSKQISGSLTFTEGSSLLASPLIEVDDTNIDTLSLTLTGAGSGLPSSNITNCAILSSGTINFTDESLAGNPIDITIDDISYPTTINNSGTTGTINLFNQIVLNSQVVHKTGVESIAGVKTFTSPTVLLEVQNPLFSNVAPQTITLSSTITASVLLGGCLYFLPAADIVVALPNATDILAAAGSIGTSQGITIRMVNASNFNVTISGNTNVSLNGLSTTGALTLTPNSAITVTLVQNTTGQFTVFGASYGSLSTVIQNSSFSTTWSGPWASPQTGNLTITRLGNVVSAKVPAFSAVSTSSTVITISTPLSLDFKPSTDTWLVTNVLVGTSTYANGIVNIQTSGNVVIYASGNRANFASGVTVGTVGTTWVWNV